MTTKKETSEEKQANKLRKSQTVTSIKDANVTAKSDPSAGKVKAKSGAAKSLDDLYEGGLKDIYWAEKSLLKALPKMQKNATNADLKKAFGDHTTQTETHITRLEDCFAEIDLKPKAEKCDAMAGLLEEAEGLMEESEAGTVRDAALIAAAQKVEHYEIATYGTLAAFAKVLGHNKGLKLLVKTLEEEKDCDENLSALADTNLNTKAI
jgi:ferritin-like metal-binding protein YciE